MPPCCPVPVEPEGWAERSDAHRLRPFAKIPAVIRYIASTILGIDCDLHRPMQRRMMARRRDGYRFRLRSRATADKSLNPSDLLPDGLFDLPDGQIRCPTDLEGVQSPLQKYFCFSEIQIKLYE
jgi:hypothetical protein